MIFQLLCQRRNTGNRCWFSGAEDTIQGCFLLASVSPVWRSLGQFLTCSDLNVDNPALSEQIQILFSSLEDIQLLLWDPGDGFGTILSGYIYKNRRGVYRIASFIPLATVSMSWVVLNNSLWRKSDINSVHQTDSGHRFGSSKMKSCSGAGIWCSVRGGGWWGTSGRLRSNICCGRTVTSTRTSQLCLSTAKRGKAPRMQNFHFFVTCSQLHHHPSTHFVSLCRIWTSQAVTCGCCPISSLPLVVLAVVPVKFGSVIFKTSRSCRFLLLLHGSTFIPR